ncbi:MAG TPA: TPM domain-containing protein [Actinomycetota bacterium]|nr:TPM domain-containing protein [Actinomycetota bacterium]
MAGELKRPISRADRRAVDNAVRDAERTTGLQFCVYLGRAEGDPRAHAETVFAAAGLQERPSVLLLVAPDRRRVEIVTAPAARERLPDEDCAAAIEEMTPSFAEGRYADGLVAGLAKLAELAGPGTGPGSDLPNIIDR